jgi:uncharacterized protein
MSVTEQSRNLIWPALILGVALIIVGVFVSGTWVEVSNRNATISVTGSAKKEINSDLVVWRSRFSRQSKTLSESYNKLKDDLAKVKKYLIAKGIPEKDLTVSAIQTRKMQEFKNGMETGVINGYELSQQIEVSSKDVDKITAISRESTELINEGVEFESFPPEYFYTKLADLKVSMLAEATKDAKARAEQIAQSSGSKIGKVRSARMGVLQITPKNSNMVSDYGVNDTSSPEKEITAVVTIGFMIQ